MSIVCGAVTTGAMLHGTINTTPWEMSRSVYRFFAVTGERHIFGRFAGRNLTAMFHPSGYATHTLLQTFISDLNALIGTYDSVVWTVGADITTYTFCIFEGFELDEDPWYDASGVNGWQVLGKLKFRQIKQ
jgi:Na+/phosphate symporter